jgi:GT2 family glycosyltransferase
MKISFIIPTYNTSRLTRHCVESLGATTSLKEHELLVIDDAGTDGTIDDLRALPINFKALKNQSNLGYAGSCNRAATSASHDLLCFCNSDLIFTPGWLTPMVKTWRTQADVGIVGNIQRRADDQTIDHIGTGFGADGRPYHVGNGHLHSPARSVLSFPAVTAACCLISRSLFEKFGGFDTGFRNGFEDTDLCLRLKQAGYRHYTASRSVISHHVSASPGRKDHEDKNQLLFLNRWRSYGEEIHRQECALWHQIETGMKKSRYYQIENYLPWLRA